MSPVQLTKVSQANPTYESEQNVASTRPDAVVHKFNTLVINNQSTLKGLFWTGCAVPMSCLTIASLWDTSNSLSRVSNGILKYCFGQDNYYTALDIAQMHLSVVNNALVTVTIGYITKQIWDNVSYHLGSQPRYIKVAVLDVSKDKGPEIE